jgi:hypothetical protein
MSEGYFNTAFWRQAGKFFKWASGYKEDVGFGAQMVYDPITKKMEYEKNPDYEAIQKTAKRAATTGVEVARAVARQPILGPASLPLFGPEGGPTIGQAAGAAGATALSAVEALYAAYHEVVERPIATSLAITGDIKRGNIGLNVESLGRVADIYKATEGTPYGENRPLTMGQALDYAGGPQIFLNPIYNLTPLANNPNFEITNRQDRQTEYIDNFSGSLRTGTADFFLQAIVGGKGVGTATRAGWQAVGRVRPVSPQNMAKMEKESADFIAQADAGKVMVPYKVGKKEFMRETLPDDFKPTSGTAEYYKELFSPAMLDSRGIADPSKLMANPLIRRQITAPYEFMAADGVASLLMQPDAVTKVPLYLLALSGSPTAFNLLKNSAPAIADGMKRNIPTNLLKPLTNDEIAYGPTKLLKSGDEIAYYTKVFEDMAQDPRVAESLLTVAAMGYSPGLTSWMPGGWKWIERQNIKASRFKDQARYAEPGPYTNTNVGGGIYRPFTIISMTEKVEGAIARGVRSLWQDRPMGFIKHTGERTYQQTNEISASLTKTKTFRKEPQLVRDYINEYIRVGPDETLRSTTTDNIIEKSLVYMAKKIAPAETPEKEIASVIARLLEELNVVKQTAIGNPTNRYGYTAIASDEGSGRVYFIDSATKASLPNSTIVPDFAAIERAMIKHWQQQGLLGRAAANTTGLYEALHQFFSATALIKFGYILKNAVVEPELRWFSFLGDVYSSEVITKALSNSTLNTVTVTKDPVSKSLSFKSNVLERAKTTFSEFTLSGIQQTKIGRARIAELQKQLNEFGSNKKTVEDLIKTDRRELVKARKKRKEFSKEGRSGLVLPIRAIEDSIEKRKQQVTAIDLQMKTLQEQISIIAGTMSPSKLAKLKSEKRSQFTESGSAFDPEWNGSAWKSNVSPVEVQFNTVMTPRLISRPATQLSKVELSPSSPSYPGAMATFMNTNLQERSFRMILAGQSDEAVAEYLIKNLNQYGEASELSRIATDYTMRQGKFKELRKYLEDPDFISQVIRTQRQIADDYFPDQIFRDFALTVNRLNDRIIIDRFGPALKEGVWPDGRPMPQLFGPLYAEKPWEGVKNIGRMTRIFEGITSVFRFGFTSVSFPEYNWLRVPFYNMKFAEALDIQATMAATVGKNKVKYIDRENPMWRGRAHEYALRAVDDVFYSIPRMNNIQYFLRFIATFPVPILNSAKFYSKAILNNPYNLILLDRVRNFPYSIGETLGGVIVDKDGNKVDRKDAFTNPEEQYLILPTKDNSSPYTRKIPLEQFGFVTDGLTPSFPVTIALSTLITKIPTLEKEFKEILGPRLYDRVLFGGRPIGEYVVTDSEDNPFDFAANQLFSTADIVFGSAYLRNASQYLQMVAKKIFTEDPELKELTSISGQTEVVNEYYIWSLINWDMSVIEGTMKEEDKPTFKDAIENAKNHFLGTAIEKFGSSVGVIKEPKTLAIKKYNTDRINYYATPEGREELNPGQSPRMAALKDTLEIWGKYAVFALAPKRENVIGRSASQKGLEKLEALKPILDKAVFENSENIDLFSLVASPLTLEDYSPAARAYLNMEVISGVPVMGRKLTINEREKLARENLALYEVDSVWVELQAALQSSKYKSISADANIELRNWWNSKLEVIYEDFKDIGFRERYNDKNGTRFNRSYSVIKAITEYKGKAWLDYLETNPEEKSLWATATQWVEDVEEFKKLREATDNRREKGYLSEAYRERVHGYIRGNTYFADLFGIYLISDPYFDRSYLIEKQLEEASTPPAARTQRRPSSSSDFKYVSPPEVQSLFN